MFFGNNKKLIIAPHNRGMVREVQEIDNAKIEENYLKEFGESPKIALGKTVALLTEIFQTILEVRIVNTICVPIPIITKLQQPSEKELFAIVCKGQQNENRIREPMDILLYERTIGKNTEYYVPPMIL